MKNTKAVWGIIAVVVTVAIIFFGKSLYKNGEQAPEATLQDPSGMDISGESAENVKPAIRKATPPEPVPPVDIPAKESSPQTFVPTQMEDPKLFDTWSANLKDMAKCLNMDIKPLNKGSEVNFEAVNQAILPDLGEVVAQYDDWTATDIKTPSGEVRRIFIQYNNDNEPPTKKVSYYTYKNGKQEVIPLTKDQSDNPTDTAIASLEGDGRVYGQSVSRRIGYINGDDLLLSEKNGKIFSYSLHHDGAQFSCTGVNKSETFKCNCKEYQNEQ